MFCRSDSRRLCNLCDVVGSYAGGDDWCFGGKRHRGKHLAAAVDDRGDLRFADADGGGAPILERAVGGIAPEHARETRDAFLDGLAASVRGGVLVDVIGKRAEDAADVGHGGEILARERLRAALEGGARRDAHDGGAREPRVDELAGREPVGVGQPARNRLAAADGDDVRGRRAEVDQERVRNTLRRRERRSRGNSSSRRRRGGAGPRPRRRSRACPSRSGSLGRTRARGGRRASRRRSCDRGTGRTARRSS